MTQSVKLKLGNKQIMDSGRIKPVTDQFVRVVTDKQQQRAVQRQESPAPGSAYAVSTETARAAVNAAALMTAGMAPTPDGIYVISSVAAKIGTAIKIAATSRGWGFWALVILFALSSSTSVWAHGNDDHGWSHLKKWWGKRHLHTHHCTHPPQNEPGTCAQEYEREIEASEIKGGRHITFSTSDLVVLDAPNVQLDSVVLNLVLRGKKNDLKKLELALNGMRAKGKHGYFLDKLFDEFFDRLNKDKDLKTWWNVRYWRYYFKWNFLWNKDSLVVSLDMTDLIVNSQDHFRDFFRNIIHNRGSITISVFGGTQVLDAELRVKGTVDMPCEETEEPAPSPTPVASPTPTPLPVAPITTIYSVDPDSTPTNQTTKVVQFNSDQSDVSFYCSFDSGPAELCSSPMSYSALGNGSHRFHVKAVNSAGIEDAVGAEHVWDIDTIAPDVTIGTVSPTGAVVSSSSMTIAFASNDSNASAYQCSHNSGAWEPCSSPVTFNGLGEGSHEVAIIASDDAGNTSLSPARYMWRVDQTAPVASINAVEPAASVTNSTAVMMTFSANESSSFECSLDGETYQTCSSPLEVSGLGEGQHQIDVRALDVAGNSSVAASYIWSVDLTAPVLAFESVVPVAGTSNARNVSAQFSSSEAASYTCSFDGSTFMACASPFSTEISVEGTHKLIVSAIDLAGNAANPIEVNWRMDFSSPQISFGTMVPSASSVINSAALTVNVTATEPVTYTSVLDGADLGQSVSPIELTALAEGPHQLVLTAVDVAGNVANTITHDFTVDLTAPVVVLNAAALSGTTNQTSNTFAFSVNEMAIFECNFNGSGFGACATPYSVAGLIEGTHIFQVRAQDQAGNVSNIVSHQWVIDQTAPKTVITTVAPSAAIIGAGSISVGFAVNDAEARSECSFDGGTFMNCANPYVVSGLSDGSHSVQVRSIDSAGNVESQPASYHFAVDGRAPTLALSANVATLTKSPSATFTFSANEVATFRCTLNGVTIQNCVSPASYDVFEGSNSFAVTASDAFGNTSSAKNFSWTVDMTAPTTTVDATQNDDNMTFTLAANEMPSTFECALDDAPFSACTANVVYSDLQAGAHVFKARAIDTAGNVDLVGATYNFEVAQALTTVITSITPDNEYTMQTAMTFEFASNDSAATFECSLDSAAYAACSSPQSYSALASGSHTFNVRSVVGTRVDQVGASHSWFVDTALPTPTSFTVSVTRNTATISWITNKPTTTMLFWGVGTSTANSIPEDSVYKTSHSVTLTGLAANTTHSYQMAGHDRTGNFMLAARRTFKTQP